MNKAVFVEPSSTHLHVYSRFTIPRLGSVLLGTIMRNRGWDVKVFVEDITPVDMAEVLSADIVGISALSTTVLRVSAKRLAKEWWKDPENRAHIGRLRNELYRDRQRAGRGAQGAVAVPEAFMQDQFGRLLERFLRELGVRVAPVTEPAAEALHRLQHRVDAIITPIVERTAKGKEELSLHLGAATAALHSNLDKWSRVIPLPVNFEQGSVYEPFARIGLLFTEDLEGIRQAYTRAGEILGLWGDLPAAAPASAPLNPPWGGARIGPR